MDRCRYPSKPCLNARAVKLNGELHRFCEQHRRQANQNQMRWSKRKQTVLRVRRSGEGEEGDDGDESQGARNAGAAAAASAGAPGDNDALHSTQGDALSGGGVSGVHPHTAGYAGRHPPLHLPPPPAGGPLGHSLSAHNVNAAGTSLSHLNLSGHGMVHSQGANGGLISSFQDHLARSGAISGANGAGLVLGGGGPVRRELAPAPPTAPLASHRGAGGVHAPPIQTALPPLLPPRVAADQVDPSAVHALLMLERAANVVSAASSAPQDGPANEEDAEDAQVRRELKRAKSNEWIARPTLSPAGLPTVASLVTNDMGSATTSSSSSTSTSVASVHATVSTIGRSSSWQPQVREDSQHESLGQWMQRKQASLQSLSNITRIEKRPYDSISSSAPSTSSGFLHRGPENNNVSAVNRGGSSSFGSSSSSVIGASSVQQHGAYHVPLHPTSSAKSNSASMSNSDPASDGGKHTALV